MVPEVSLFKPSLRARIYVWGNRTNIQGGRMIPFPELSIKAHCANAYRIPPTITATNWTGKAVS